jgi:hypothetical protein
MPHSKADVVLLDAFGGGRKGMYTTFPPAISMLLIYLCCRNAYQHLYSLRIKLCLDVEYSGSYLKKYDKTVDVLVKKRLEHNNLIPWIQKSHKCT